MPAPSGAVGGVREGDRRYDWKAKGARVLAGGRFFVRTAAALAARRILFRQVTPKSQFYAFWLVTTPRQQPIIGVLWER